MSPEIDISQAEIDQLYETLHRQAEAAGYHLNPDVAFTKDLVRSLLVNGRRYGYWACPCRLATGSRAADLDIVCPCDYRDADLTDFDACYCALYVSQQVLEGRKTVHSIPERRPPAAASGRRHRMAPGSARSSVASPPLPVWRCRVCGYLCARDQPPETCPICKAGKERFEKFF